MVLCNVVDLSLVPDHTLCRLVFIIPRCLSSSFKNHFRAGQQSSPVGVSPRTQSAAPCAASEQTYLRSGYTLPISAAREHAGC